MNKKILLFIAFLLVCISLTPMQSVAQTRDKIDVSLKQAHTLYANGQFEQAQHLLLRILKEKNLSQSQQLRALILLAEIRRAMLDEDGARKLINKILDIRPDFTPSETDYPPTFIALVQSEKQKRMAKTAKTGAQSRSFFKNKYFWIGLGGTAAATTAIILGTRKSGGKSAKPLATPPNWPEHVR